MAGERKGNEYVYVAQGVAELEAHSETTLHAKMTQTRGIIPFFSLRLLFVRSFAFEYIDTKE